MQVKALIGTVHVAYLGTSLIRIAPAFPEFLKIARDHAHKFIGYLHDDHFIMLSNIVYVTLMIR